MEKALFSITCTTCHARLVVRAEEAIGTILECPKCESMVHIVPPEGWNPSPPPGQAALPADAAAPPPLDRISAAPLTLDLDPAANSLLGNLWLPWSAALIVVALLGWGIWSFLTPRSTSESVARAESESPAAATAGINGKQPLPPPGPQPGGVSSPGKTDNTAISTAPTAKVDKPVEASPPAAPTSTPASPPASTSLSASEPSVKTKPAAEQPPLFPPVPDKPDAAKPPAEVKKLPPASVDVAARLADPLAEINLNDATLIGVMDLLSSLSTVPITLDADALLQLGVAPRDRITLRIGPTTVGEALRAAAAKRGLGLIVDGGEAIVTAPAEYRETTQKIPYTVSDLAGNDRAGMEKLADLIRTLVAPQSWQSGGGPGSIEPDGDALSVVQTAGVHRRILIFCEKLRNARGLPLRSHEAPELFSLKTRTEQARNTRARPVTANFHEPAPLARILAYLSQAAGCDILVDRAALAQADTSDQVEATLTARKQALGEALAALLRPLGLTYRIVGGELLQVTTDDAAKERLELEFYPIGPWLERGISAERLEEQLKARVAPVSWSDVGGEAEIYFDAPSRCLIVLQSQPAQAKIQQLLATPPAKR